jgi:N-terminal domain of anti-restriction factor ArdC
MKRDQIQREALTKAATGQSLTNYAAIIAGFAAKGIPAEQIRPRENVFTFHAWKALGRSVKRGEHGVKVLTYIEGTRKERGPDGAEIAKPCRRPWTTTVFHVSQTEERRGTA